MIVAAHMMISCTAQNQSSFDIVPMIRCICTCIALLSAVPGSHDGQDCSLVELDSLICYELWHTQVGQKYAPHLLVCEPIVDVCYCPVLTKVRPSGHADFYAVCIVTPQEWTRITGRPWEEATKEHSRNSNTASMDPRIPLPITPTRRSSTANRVHSVPSAPNPTSSPDMYEVYSTWAFILVFTTWLISTIASGLRHLFRDSRRSASTSVPFESRRSRAPLHRKHHSNAKIANSRTPRN